MGWIATASEWAEQSCGELDQRQTPIPGQPGPA